MPGGKAVKKQTIKVSYHDQSFINPETGKKILVGGPTHLDLVKRGKVPRHPKISKEMHEKMMYTKKGLPAGGSNVRKYKKEHLPVSAFCGPFGGSPSGSYPVNTYGRYRASLAYARNAPNPAGIVACARRKAKEHGWI